MALYGTSLVAQYHALKAGGVGSISGWGTKIPPAVRCSQKINFEKKDGTLQMQGGVIIIVVKTTTIIIMQITEALSALGERELPGGKQSCPFPCRIF